MKASFDLADKLRVLGNKVDKCPTVIKKVITRNALAACKEMEKAAKMHTPNSGDGKTRGMNVISNSLQNSWKVKTTLDSEGKLIKTVELINEKPYAPFVQYGHRMTRHFVPWLYKDSSGTLSYETNHNQPMFGIIVGTKTTYVKPVDMISPAFAAFDKTFERRNKIALLVALSFFV